MNVNLKRKLRNNTSNNMIMDCNKYIVAYFAFERRILFVQFDRS